MALLDTVPNHGLVFRSMEQPITLRVASNVRAEIARAGYSGRELARRLGWSVSSTSRRLNGRTPLGVDELVTIAALLDIPVNRLLSDADATAEPVSA